MKNLTLIYLISLISCVSTTPLPGQSPNTYTLVVEGFDWGAAASKVILDLEEEVSSVPAGTYAVDVARTSHCADLDPKEATGQLKVLYSYVSDGKGNRAKEGEHITLILFAAPWETIGAPVKYYWNNPKCPGNVWIGFDLTITNSNTGQIWNKEKDRIIPLIDDFDLSGSFEYEGKTIGYADYQPDNIDDLRPLIIWLHGGGEGGTDTSIPLIANRAANYASSEMQAYFDGAYVLVPQSPTFWMDKGNGDYTRGAVDDCYFKSLKALIDNYLDEHPQVDRNRIYVGGCSNGGYMTIKLMLEYPNYFAAGFPSALAYYDEFISEDELQTLKDQKIWFIHSADDGTTPPDITVIPLYNRLIKAGASDVHLSYFDHVIDITNQFGGSSYNYSGHFSWVYSHANKCQLDYDGSPVKVDGQPVTLMGWLARQRL